MEKENKVILILAALALLAVLIKGALSMAHSTAILPEPQKEYKAVNCSALSAWDNIGTNDDKAIRDLRIGYINRFHKVAMSEYYKFGIPASIILAQGLIETQNGTSRLLLATNNHFGIKCFSKSCRAGHCSNHSDDSHKDFFRVYPSAWESFRSHSILLSSSRYKSLKWKDYKAWAWGLKNRGYATDKHYPQKLIKIISEYKLNRFDR